MSAASTLTSPLNHDAVLTGPDRHPLLMLMLGRAVLLLVLLIALSALMGTDAISFYAFVSLAFVLIIPLSLWFRSGRINGEMVGPHFIVDVVVITGIVHFSGGIISQMCLLYPLVILSAGVTESGRLAAKIALLSIILYSTLIILEMQGILIYRGPVADAYASVPAVVQHLTLRIVVFCFFAAASSCLANRCAYQTRRIQGLKALTQLIFDHASVGLLAVRDDGRIVLANQAAERLLGIDRQAICRRFLDDFVPGCTPRLKVPEQFSQIHEMKRSDGTLFPSALSASAAAVPIADDPQDGRCVIAFWDMTEIVRREDESRESVRIETVMNMAGEIAHWIRNPLTAIKLAEELVSSTVEADGAAVDSTVDASLVTTMCRVIADETRRLEERINYFLKCSRATDRSRLKDIIDEADVWAARIKPLYGDQTSE